LYENNIILDIQQSNYKTMIKKLLLLNRKKLWLAGLFVLFFATSTYADPFIDSCGADTCYFVQAESSVYGCSGEIINLYALHPDTSSFLGEATYQWWTYDFYFYNDAWQDGPIPIGGATDNKYTVNNTGSYPYYCEVTIGGNTYTTGEVYISFIFNPPVITTEPDDANACLGDEISFISTASGDDLQFQWEQKISGGSWELIPGAEESTYTFTPEPTDDQNNFRVRVYSQCKFVNSSPALLQVSSPPVITDHPDTTGRCEGTSASFVTAASGSGLDYIWFRSTNSGASWDTLKNGGPYLSEDGVLTISDLHAGLDGYSFRCDVLAGCDFKSTSDAGLLQIKQQPELFTQPQSLEVCYGEEFTLSATATGTQPIYFQWRKDLIAVTGLLTDTVFYVGAAGDFDGGSYELRLTNECTTGPVSSDAAEVTVHDLPDPEPGEDIHVCQGDSIMLDAGSDYSSYAWSNGETIRTFHTGTAGNYKVTVVDINSCFGTDSVMVFVDEQLTHPELGEDANYCEGEEVILSAQGDYDIFSWSSGSDQATISALSSGKYWLTVSSNSSVCEASDTINIFIASPYEEDHICLITTDFETGKNLVIWEKTPDQATVAYNIYKETNVLNVYAVIGTVPYEDLSVFLDTVSDPNIRQWIYKITALDTCGNESDVAVSPYHKPLFLQYVSTDGGVNLAWDRYEVEGNEMDFVTYQIYRGVDSSSLVQIDEVPASLYLYKDTDPNALTNKFYYRVAGVRTDTCFPVQNNKADSGPYSHSLSNLEDNRLKDTQDPTFISGQEIVKPVLVYPNPMNYVATVRLSDANSQEYRLIIRDMSGKLVRMIEGITGNEVTIHRGDLTGGYYHIELTGDHYLFKGMLMIQ